MALLRMILRKMVQNRWLELSLLLGLVVTVALASSMPIYTQAILQRLLIKDLELLQKDTRQYPGTVSGFAYLSGVGTLQQKMDQLMQADRFISEQGPRFQLPVLFYTRMRGTTSLELKPTDNLKADASIHRAADILAINDMKDHVRLVDGRLPSPEAVDGVYEAVVTQSALSNLKMVVGNEFSARDDFTGQTIKISIVGVIDRKDNQDVYWNDDLSKYYANMFIDFDLFERDFTQGQKVLVISTLWRYALDYSQLKLDRVSSFSDAARAMEGYMSSDFKAPALQTIDGYFAKEKKLKTLLWSLNVPVLIMLGFYLFMVANLIVDRQKTEIAVLRSRGASRLQIVLSYAVEGVLLGIVACLIGPYVGLLLTRVLGASSGFLEFVQRAALDVRLNGDALRYALTAVAVSVVMTLIPVWLATRVSIVGHKQSSARHMKMPIWQIIYLDVILLGLSLYMLRSFHQRMRDLVALGLDSTALNIDPLLFLVPAFFILGLGMLMLRVYPWVVRLVYWAGKRWWPPSLYSALIQVGRSAAQYQFIMLFLAMTIATGLFSASAARTMNQNVEDRIRYQNGADIVIQSGWESNAPPPVSEPASTSAANPAPKRIQFVEPPFLPLRELSGVQSAARVFVKKQATFISGKKNTFMTLMGIDTDDFGRTAWMRDGLLRHHINEYLNLISTDPTAVLISRSIAEEDGIKVGDVMKASWSGIEGTSFRVYGIIDYWPGWNPNQVLTPGQTVTSKDGRTKAERPKLVVGHLPYIQNNMALEPYGVWLKLKPEASSRQLYEDLERKKLPIISLTDTEQQLIRSKNDPFQLALNGVMTLGFLIAILISFMGFLLYWVLTLSSRILQFGVFRAMGLSFRNMIAMLAAEQLLTSGAGVLIGIGAGNLTSNLFVPLFQITFDPSQQVPPFRVIFDQTDRFHLYLIISGMILIGLLILGTMLSRIKIHQAVKLGED
jgi:putative ABC transport system permease protein